MSVTLLALAAAIPTCGFTAADEGSLYKGPALFSTRPSETRALQTIKRFGPVGVGINLIQPALTMKLRNTEVRSPAEATGELKPGQIIETINGQKLADIDPRIQLGQTVAAAEATDGILKFMVKDKAGAAAEEVVVKIPVLSAYSKTWPLNCPKSDKIVRTSPTTWPSATPNAASAASAIPRCCSCSPPVRERTWTQCANG